MQKTSFHGVFTLDFKISKMVINKGLAMDLSGSLISAFYLNHVGYKVKIYRRRKKYG